MSSKLFSKGFTLIELMIVVMVVAIFSVIAIPSYQSYARKALESQVQQEMQNLAMRLERIKSRNFNYKNNELAQVVIPAGATGDAIKYTIEIREGTITEIKGVDPDTGAETKTYEHLLLSDSEASGRTWSIRAEATNAKNYNFLMTSQGTKCKNKTKANVTFSACASAGSEVW